MHSSNILRTPPSIISLEELTLPRTWDASWQNSYYNKVFTLVFDNDKVGGRVTFFTLPPDLADERARFEKYALSNGGSAFTYSFGELGVQKREVSLADDNVFHPSLFIEEVERIPKRPSLDQLKLLLLEERRRVFYIGAGISLASGVFTLRELNAALGIDWAVAVDSATRNVLDGELDAVLTPFTTFCRSAFDAPPSAAHWALARIALHLGTPILSENFDHLLQKTGVQPLTTAVDKDLVEISDEELQEIDEVWCLGLSHDARGLLGRYKRAHPKGRIVALSRTLPLYVGAEDFFIEGDLQEILPLLADELEPDLGGSVVSKERPFTDVATKNG